MPFDMDPQPQNPKFYYRNCDGCDAPLKYVGPEAKDGAWTSLQADDALMIQLSGGYGMAIDPCMEPEPALTQLFCAKCCERLCAQWPSIARVIERHCSSSMAHHCTKTKSFVWTPSTHCDEYCSACGRWGANNRVWDYETSKPIGCATWYDRPTIACECGVTALAVWDWERVDRCSKHDIALQPPDGCYVCRNEKEPVAGSESED